ncbi:MAG: fasciclin domain-containing protein, partial [Anaerolineae bacterium]|nr:fasciclin domain-containing protein [Anaerolineae bacterium]
LGRLGISAADLLSDTDLLNDVLLYHVLAGEYDAATLFERANSPWPGTYIQSLQGTYLEFTDDDGSLIVDASWVQAADIQASNGIVHVIYEVLLPSYDYGEEGLPG